MAAKVAIILGTRPEIIKMAPIIREVDIRDIEYFVIHTGQHYSYNLDGVFFEKLRLELPSYNIEAGSGTQATQTARILEGVEEILVRRQPEVVLVQGDTNSVLAGTLAAAKLHIKVGHVEAGLRSYDRDMPEEINRVVADHISDYLFAPTEKAEKILMGEGIPQEKIFMTGNTVVDALYQNIEIARRVSHILDTLEVKPAQYFLATAHRAANVDNPERFASILEGLEKVANFYHQPVIYAIHPHALARLKEYGLEPKNIRLIDPVDYFDSLILQNYARCVLTDSGGLQEEACILGVPCVTLRDNTERPETLEVGANRLAGTDADDILENVRLTFEIERRWTNPFGDGKAGEKIVDIITGGSHG
ncbi:MAG: UDP-N-acetylglucosamine 2-epimerase (non-hydrolyzing) [Dehalococcoidales bacterium]|nr:UDP-N-acetylglucosamine 2-epimerase (non-hydrolyzing) [Dehalococcoidales bacterium]